MEFATTNTPASLGILGANMGGIHTANLVLKLFGGDAMNPALGVFIGWFFNLIFLGCILGAVIYAGIHIHDIWSIYHKIGEDQSVKSATLKKAIIRTTIGTAAFLIFPIIFPIITQYVGDTITNNPSPKDGKTPVISQIAFLNTNDLMINSNILHSQGAMLFNLIK